MDYFTAKEKIDKLLSNTSVMWLATAKNSGEVSLRQMCVLFLDGKIYFQTDHTLDKYADIIENSHVALGVGCYSFQGKAKVLGKTTDCAKILNAYKLALPDTFNKYTLLENEVFIEVELNKCKIWNAHDLDHEGKETITTIDLLKKSVTFRYC